ncbi:MAG: hypothetical protein E7176_01310 [Erysipelotrichaceae bacterium]|nr:hypothetical protein [Erysipelotrichaceae bacterium]
MIKKLYECDCFDYQKFILNNTKQLSLSADETVVLIKLLDNYKSSKIMSTNSFKSLSLTKTHLEKALLGLLERMFYEIYINYDNGTGVEHISLDGFFAKAERLLNNKISNPDDELFQVNKYLKEEFNRLLVAKELDIVSSLVIEDCYRLNDFIRAVENLKSKDKLLSIKNIAQALAIKEEDEKPKASPAPKCVQAFFNSIK